MVLTSRPLVGDAAMTYRSLPAPLLALRTVTYCTENEWPPVNTSRSPGSLVKTCVGLASSSGLGGGQRDVVAPLAQIVP